MSPQSDTATVKVALAKNHDAIDGTTPSGRGHALSAIGPKRRITDPEFVAFVLCFGKDLMNPALDRKGMNVLVDRWNQRFSGHKSQVSFNEIDFSTFARTSGSKDTINTSELLAVLGPQQARRSCLVNKSFLNFVDHTHPSMVAKGLTAADVSKLVDEFNAKNKDDFSKNVFFSYKQHQSLAHGNKSITPKIFETIIRGVSANLEEQNLTSPTLRGGKEIQQKFPFLKHIGGWEVRPVFGTSKMSEHAQGRALDCMIYVPRSKDGADLVSYLIASRNRLGIQYIIYNRSQWSDVLNWKPRPYVHPSGRTDNPTLNHEDHVHITFRKEPKPR